MPRVGGLARARVVTSARSVVANTAGISAMVWPATGAIFAGQVGGVEIDAGDRTRTGGVSSQ
jgi:hypothetical protein